MGAAPVNKAIDISENMSGACTIDYTVEYYNTGGGTWDAPTSVPFVSWASGTDNFDIYLDGIDADSISYRPQTSFDLRITAFMPDSIQTVDKTTIQDAFTITIEDECKDD